MLVGKKITKINKHAALLFGTINYPPGQLWKIPMPKKQPKMLQCKANPKFKLQLQYETGEILENMAETHF